VEIFEKRVEEESSILLVEEVMRENLNNDVESKGKQALYRLDLSFISRQVSEK